jgi:hypothetical protein
MKRQKVHRQQRQHRRQHFNRPQRQLEKQPSQNEKLKGEKVTLCSLGKIEKMTRKFAFLQHQKWFLLSETTNLKVATLVFLF